MAKIKKLHKEKMSLEEIRKNQGKKGVPKTANLEFETVDMTYAPEGMDINSPNININMPKLMISCVFLN